MRFASAGHEPALLYDPRENRFQDLRGIGLPLGIEETNFQEFHHEGLNPGQIIVIGTDGVWETRNLHGELFDKNRLRDAVRASASRSAAEIAASITQALADFRGDVKQADDVTFVVIKITAQSDSLSPSRAEG